MRIRALLALLFLACVAHAQTPGPVTGLQIWTQPTTVGPTATSVAAATATANNNALCATSRLGAYYWEVGDATGTLVSASRGTPTETATTKHSIASGSKWMYAIYVAEAKAGVLTTGNTGDTGFLSFISGYANMGNGTGSGASATCPNTDSPRTITQCLTHSGYTTQLAPSVGHFDYDAGHMENHAGALTAIKNAGVGSLFSTINVTLGSTSDCIYSQPTPAEGLFCSANGYTSVLRKVVANQLQMHDLLGTSAVCTTVGGACGAVHTPIGEAWHYSIGHWVEDDASTSGDGAFSSPGAFGFYPWIDASKTYYGVLSRQAPSGGQGLISAQCGRLIRHAFMTGTEQTDPTPDQS